jgi:DNA-binding NarL/FixJ family response regulator
LSVLEVLSVRERDVFRLAAKGLSNGEMAEGLFVSEATIKTHLRSVLDMLELRTRIQLVAFAQERRLLGN